MHGELCNSVSAGSVCVADDWKAKVGWDLDDSLLALSPVTAGQGDRSVPSKLWHSLPPHERLEAGVGEEYDGPIPLILEFVF